MRASIVLLVVVVAALTNGVAAEVPAAEAAAPAAAPKPNIVFLLADDLGSHDVGWRGSDIKTPHLDQLALAGARLEQFYVQPVCSPTRAALMTGRYPFRHGLQVGVVRPWAQYGLPLEERTLAQALHEAGYQTAITGKWHLGHFQPAYLPTHRGFDHQYGHYNGALDYFTHIRDDAFDWHRDDRENHDEGYSTHLIAREAVQRIRERDKSRPFFLYVPFNAVHGPHQVPDSYSAPYESREGNRRVYAGMLAALDEGVGQIVDAIRDSGLADNTLFIFSSDNGGPNPGKLTDNGPLRRQRDRVRRGRSRVRLRDLAWQDPRRHPGRGTAAYGRLVSNALEPGRRIDRAKAARRWSRSVAGAGRRRYTRRARDRHQHDPQQRRDSRRQLEIGDQWRQRHERRRRRTGGGESQQGRIGRTVRPGR